MKGLLVTSFFPPLTGGAPEVYGQLCRRLAPEIGVVAPGADPNTGEPLAGVREHDAASAYRIRRTDLFRPARGPGGGALRSALGWLRRDLPLARRLARAVGEEIRAGDPEFVCLGQVWALDRLAARIAGRWGRRLVFFVHGEEITAPTIGRWYGRRGFEMLRRADVVVTVSEFSRRALLARAGTAPERVHVLPNGVDLQWFRPGAPDPALLARHGLAGRRVLLAVGRLVPRKGIDVAIRALPAIRARVPEAALLVVGEGPEEARLRREAVDAGVGADVRFAGSVSRADIAAYYRAGEVFVLPTREMPDGDTEGFGLVFLEANACGRAVVAGRAGGVPEAVEDGVSGLLVDGARPEEVAAAALRLLTEPALAARLAAGGMERAARFSWDAQAARFLALCAP